MAQTLSIYFPKGKEGLQKELDKLAKKQDRSINYLVVKAIEEYVKKDQRRKR